MSRRAAAPHRTILPDPKFGKDMLAKFINMVMERGKKSAAEKIVYGAIDRIGDKSGRAGGEAIAVLQQALDNVKPVVEVKSRRVGGATYQVPVEVRANRRQTLAMRWVIEAATAQRKSMAHRLPRNSWKPQRIAAPRSLARERPHRMAEANKAFAHYRW
jgi:small subunit ribosomal protein S7